MKPHIRVIGIDDGSFSFEDNRATVVGVAVELPGYVDGVMVTDVEIDGQDSTGQIIEMLLKSRYLEGTRLILIDGAALGGFNVFDPWEIHKKTGVAVITVTRDRPNFHEIEKALRKHFEDWEERLAMMKFLSPEPYEVGNSTIYVGRVGIEVEDVLEFLELATIKGALPEALRIAHLIASAISRGESRGRA